MSNDFENSQEYRKALEIAKKQQELYKNVTRAISPEALAKFQELSDKLNEWKNSLNNMPGLLKLAEMLKNYQQEVRETEGLTEAEFEEKYRSEIEWSEKFGKNGWVISEHSNPADIKNWEQLLCEGEAKVAEFFDGEDIVILDVIIEGLQEKYVSDETQLYFKNGMQAFENEDYMTAAMYLLALLDNRVNELVDFPNQRMSYRVKYSNDGFANQKAEDFRQLTEKRGFMSKKEKEARKKQKTVDVKELRLSPSIDTHDVQVKVKKANEFLKDGDKVKISIRFRGREIGHSKVGMQIMEDFAKATEEFGTVDKQPKMEGKSLVMFLAPKN